jgi:hypothetical protein
MDSLSINAKLVWFPCLKELTLPCKGVTPDQLDKFDVTKRYGMLAICDCLNAGPSKPSGVKIRNEL